MIARILCENPRWKKEPAQGAKIANKVDFTLLHYKYDDTLDYCEHMTDVYMFGPAWANPNEA